MNNGQMDRGDKSNPAFALMTEEKPRKNLT